MRRTLLALGGVAMLLATACGTSDDRTSVPPTAITAPLPAPTTSDPPATTPATSVAPAPTTTVPDTSVVPATITVAYVDAVLARLDHVYGDALRSLVTANRVTASVLEDLSAIYEPRLYLTEAGIFARGPQTGLDNIKTHPGDRHTTVTQLIYVSPTCVFARVEIDEAGVDRRQVALPYATYEGIRFVALTAGSGPNPTPWKFFDDLAIRGPQKVVNACLDQESS